MLMQPFGNRIQVAPQKDDFILSDKMQEQIGDVIAVGPEVKHVKTGDRIIFTPWGIDSYRTQDGESYYFIPESY